MNHNNEKKCDCESFKRSGVCNHQYNSTCHKSDNGGEEVLGCEHGRLVGQACPHCLGLTANAAPAPLPHPQEEGENGLNVRKALYGRWENMVARCTNEKNKGFKNYGARGIKVEWGSFQEFVDDMGESFLAHLKKHGRKHTTIDRIDNNGNYSKENCRWATYFEQAKNRRPLRKRDKCKNGHPFSPENTRIVKNTKNGPHRRCITCIRAGQFAVYHKDPEKMLSRQRKWYREKYKTYSQGVEDEKARIIGLVDGLKMPKHENNCRDWRDCSCGVSAFNASLEALKEKINNQDV